MEGQDILVAGAGWRGRLDRGHQAVIRKVSKPCEARGATRAVGRKMVGSQGLLDSQTEMSGIIETERPRTAMKSAWEWNVSKGQPRTMSATEHNTTARRT